MAGWNQGKTLNNIMFVALLRAFDVASSHVFKPQNLYLSVKFLGHYAFK